MPQIVGSYLAASFGLIQFMEWCVVKDIFSADYIILAFRFLFFVTPSVVLFAWYHGRPGPDRWRKVEKIFIPFNVMAAVTLLVLMSFNMSFLRAGQTTVTLEDEEGNTIERVIPDAESRKSLAVFFFENKSANPEYEHYRDGITFSITYDLMQDIMITQAGAYNMVEDLMKLSPSDPYDLALPIQKKLATDYRAAHFVSGDFDIVDGAEVIRTRLYETKTGKLLQERVFSGAQHPELIDQASLQLRRDLGVPEYHIQETTDLPLREMTTDNPEVFKSYMQGLRIVSIRNDYPAAIKKLEESVEMDPNYALAWFQLVQFYANGNTPEKVGPAMRKCMDLIYLFPERLQFTVKTVNFLVMQQPEKRMKVLEMYKELYPRDPEVVEPIYQKALLLRSLGRYDDARELFNRVLLMEPGNIDAVCYISSIDMRLARFDEAGKHFGMAVSEARTPRERATACQWQSSYHRWQGKMKQAIEWKEKEVDERQYFDVPLNLKFHRIDEIPWYLAIGQEAEAAQLVEEIRAVFSNIFQDAAGFADMVYGLGIEDTVMAADAIIRAERFNAVFGNLNEMIVAGQANLLELKGDYGGAEATFRGLMESSPEARKYRLEDVARVQRLQGKHEAALKTMEELLERYPGGGIYQLELARIYQAMGRNIFAPPGLTFPLSFSCFTPPKRPL